MCKSKISCPSESGVKGQIKGPSGAFVRYCNFSCFYIIQLLATLKISTNNNKTIWTTEDYFLSVNT